MPTEKAVKVALRTQQLIAYEIGVANTIDPLGGSYYVEALTNRMEEKAREYFEKIEQLGGVIPAIEKGFFQREIAKSAYLYQKAVDAKKRVIVGVNEFVDEEPSSIETLKIDPSVEKHQIQRLRTVKKERNGTRVKESLESLREAASGGQNLMPRILDCVRAYATIGEMTDLLREEFGEYREPPIFW